MRESQERIDIEVFLDRFGQPIESMVDQLSMVVAAAARADAVQECGPQARAAQQSVAVRPKHAAILADRTIRRPIVAVCEWFLAVCPCGDAHVHLITHE